MASELPQKFPDREAATIKKDLSNFYNAALTYCIWKSGMTSQLENNYQKNAACLALKSRFTFSQLSDVVEALQIRGKLDMDDLYDEYCVTLPRQQEIVEKRLLFWRRSGPSCLKAPTH